MSGQMCYSALTERKLAAAADYNLYFENDNYNGIKILSLEIGKINLPSGRIIACDPLTGLGRREEICIPFDYTVEPGQYPVTLCVAKGSVSTGGDRYAAARIRFTDQRPVKWLLALRGNEDLADLKQDGDYFGYPADAGVGCFVDAQGRDTYLRFCDFLSKYKKDLYDDFFHVQFMESYKKFPMNQRENGDWFNTPIPGDDQVNLVVFQAGFGDGIYPCYWGLDENGTPAQLVADFFVLAD